MGEETQSNYDYIVIGTGLSESLISCSLAKRGKKVLHLDENDYYGETFVSLNFSGALKYFHQKETNEAEKLRSASTNVSINGKDEKLIAPGGKSPNFLLIPISSTSEEETKQLQLLEIYQRYFSRYYPASKKSSYFHPAYYNLLAKPQERASPVRINEPSLAHDSSHLHPAYYPLIKSTKEEDFLKLLIHLDRYFNIDLTPKMIYCSGQLINSIIQSNVHHYLEFKPMNSLYYFLSSSSLTSSTGKLSGMMKSVTLTTSSAVEGSSPPPYQIWKVPSTKNDIFMSSHLTAMEKRLLMKFYQYIFDWSQLQRGKNLLLLNEKELKNGRALYRPQNKTIESTNDNNTSETSATTSTDIIYNQKNYKDSTFLQFLKAFQLSEKLQYIIIYALCLHYTSSTSTPTTTPPTPPTTEAINELVKEEKTVESLYNEVTSKTIHECLQDLSLYFNSIGIFGETAFLLPLYGISEIVQGFCRMSAVWGSTFMLRQTVTQILETSNKDIEGDEQDKKESVSEEKREQPEKVNEKESDQKEKKGLLKVKDNEGNEFTCSKLISNFIYFPNTVTCAPYFSYHLIVILSSPSSNSQSKSNGEKDDDEEDKTSPVASFFPQERTIGMIPPNFQFNDPNTSKSIIELNNKYTMYLHQADKSTESTPEGMTVLHIHTLIEDTFTNNTQGRLHHWEDRAREQFHYCEELTDHLLLLLKCHDNIQFIDYVGGGVAPAAGEKGDTSLEDDSSSIRILFSRAFLRPLAEHSWIYHEESKNIILTNSMNYSTLHLEQEVETAKRVVYELLTSDTDNNKLELKSYAEFELFEEEKKQKKGGEEGTEDGENEGNEGDEPTAPADTGEDESEEASDAREYLRLYQNILASSTTPTPASTTNPPPTAPVTANSSDEQVVN